MASSSRSPDWSSRRLHFVGIGGAGMSGLALLARALGARVTGSDRSESAYTEELRRHGIEPVIGHAAANVPAGAEVVYSTAVAPDNPERAAAGGRQLHRAQLLAQLAAARSCIAVSGTHGKTTTAAMIVHALDGAGLEPSYVLGGALRPGGPNARWREGGRWIVVEADESDRSLLALEPQVAVLTSAELDHHATYASRLELEQTLRAFLARADTAVVWDRPRLRALSPPGAVFYDAGEVLLRAGGSRFSWGGVDVQLSVPGVHNAINAAGALTAAKLAGADPAAAAAALADFRGAGRRFELLGRTASGAVVYDDYAHHPTEVAVTLAAARTLAPRRLVAVFQPHLFSRTRSLWREFGVALAAADVVCVLEVYPARERAEDFPGVSGRLIAVAAAEAAGGRTVAWLPDFAQAERFLTGELRDGDMCLVMGAGDVDRLGRRLLAAR